MVVSLILATLTLTKLSWERGGGEAKVFEGDASTFPGYVVYERALENSIVKVPGTVIRANSQFVAVYDSFGVTVIATPRFRGMIIP